jgi:hypothetical protein
MALGLIDRYISGTGSVVDSGKHKGNQTMQTLSKFESVIQSDSFYFVVMTIMGMNFLFIGFIAGGFISSIGFIAGGFYLGHVVTKLFNKGE